MKKIYLMLLVVALNCLSCSDFLEETPKDELSSDQFFTDPAHAFSAVNSLYRNGAPQMYDGEPYTGTRMMFIQYMSGFFDNQYKGQEVHVQHAQQLTLNGTNIAGYLDDIWADLYTGISRANTAIKNIPTTPELSESEVNQLLGEARFFRAYAYYYLVRMFGGVPLITEPYETLDNLYAERASLQDVYAFIEEDLSFAVNESGLAETRMADNDSRITKSVASTLLAEVYLTMSGYPLQENHYSDAAAMAKKIINQELGAYSLIQHEMSGGNIVFENSAYNQMRKSDVSPSEYIYYKEYDATIAASNYTRWTYPAGVGLEDGVVKYSVINGAYQPVDEFLLSYDPDNDLRIQDKQYFHSSITVDGVVKNFPATPFIWHDDVALFETASSGKDIVIYSYADVLLIAAEAIAKSEGVTPEAIDYLAQVRGRAYWKQDVNAIKATLSGLSPEAFVEEVWKERNRELVFEFHLWFDILRTRKYPTTEANNPGEITFVDVVGQTNPWGKTFEEKSLLFPLSDNERQRNPSLGANNPGY